MKRSEMEYQLNNLLMDRLSEWAAANDGKVPLLNNVMEDLSQHILHHVERAGMLPPDFYFEIDVDTKSSTRIHEWEPEDET